MHLVFDCACEIHTRKFHGHSRAILVLSKCLTRSAQRMKQLVIFFTASVDVLVRGDANNRMASFGGDTTSNFAFQIKPFQRLHAVT